MARSKQKGLPSYAMTNKDTFGAGQRFYNIFGHWTCQSQNESLIQILTDAGICQPIQPPQIEPTKPKCENGKAIFDNRYEAAGRMRELALINDGRKKPIRVYKCQMCNGWHLSSITRKQQERIEENQAKYQ
jgi:uncharacterized protein YlaI